MNNQEYENDIIKQRMTKALSAISSVDAALERNDFGVIQGIVTRAKDEDKTLLEKQLNPQIE
jgi:hypothetical protein